MTDYSPSAVAVAAESFDAMILTRTVWGEARGEPHAGKLAVAYVVINRFKSGKWFAGKTVASTCMKAQQFSCWNAGDAKREKMCDATLADLDESQAAALAAVLGTQGDPTEGCTHYHYVGISPPWASGKQPHVTIGRHSFYKEID